MGVIYRAQDLKLDRLVALKSLLLDLACDSEAKQRFVHGAKGASAFDHPNICSVHDIGETKIMDFGLAKLGDGTMLTKTGSMLGTTGYMSPELSET